MDLNVSVCMLQVILTVFDIRGDRIPNGVELHAYGMAFVNPSEEGQANVIRVLTAAMDCRPTALELRAGK
jgi:hypothetical protein